MSEELNAMGRPFRPFSEFGGNEAAFNMYNFGYNPGGSSMRRTQPMPFPGSSYGSRVDPAADSVAIRSIMGQLQPAGAAVGAPAAAPTQQQSADDAFKAFKLGENDESKLADQLRDRLNRPAGSEGASPAGAGALGLMRGLPAGVRAALSALRLGPAARGVPAGDPAGTSAPDSPLADPEFDRMAMMRMMGSAGRGR